MSSESESGAYLHHVAITTGDVPLTADFYASIVGMRQVEFPFIGQDDPRAGSFGRGPDHIACFDDGSRQMHVALREGDFGRRNDMWINPVLNGHVAIAVPDLGAVKERLASRDMPYFESGVWAFQGRTQIYCYDPAHNVVEISQSVDR